MFAHEDISRKVYGPTRSESAPHLLVWVYERNEAEIFNSGFSLENPSNKYCKLNKDINNLNWWEVNHWPRSSPPKSVCSKMEDLS